MTTKTNYNTTRVKNDLVENGFALIPGFFNDSVELKNLKQAIYNIVCFKAEQNNLRIPENTQTDINKTVLKLGKLDDNIIACLNDVINALAESFALLNAPALHEFMKKIFNDESAIVLANNHRIRIQVPGRDEISNLPWHQDAHYNKLYIKDNCYVCWFSISDVPSELNVVFKKGSHVIGEVERVEHFRPNGGLTWTVENKYVQDERFEKFSTDTKAGDLALIDMNVIHRSGYNISGDHVKFSGQVRYHNGSAGDFMGGAMGKYN